MELRPRRLSKRNVSHQLLLPKSGETAQGLVGALLTSCHHLAGAIHIECLAWPWQIDPLSIEQRLMVPRTRSLV